MIRRTALALAAMLTLASASAAVTQAPADAEPFPAVNSCDELEHESIEWWNCVDFLYYGWWWWDEPTTADLDTLVADQTGESTELLVFVRPTVTAGR